ncbi:glutamate ABC transporter substrate-binding protein [Mobilicoccus sp.]|uniref:glutamate ABC transporter substrate-binding protein n=1 Tax=Mobilicoccus sp. TaxID=2034349 RepID=UPI0028B20403|nr:glutamate ABC transporter substrate-binding protein [Mobilicoccus sp.]
MKRTTTTVLALVSAAALALSGCGAGTTGAGGGGGGDDSLRVGIKFDQPGMGLKKGEEYSGLDVDVAKYVAKELGKTPTFSEAPSPQRETLLKAGQLDMIVATYSITDKRKQEVGFAGPYFVAGQDLLVRSDEKAITGPETLSGKKLCSVKGSTPAQRVKEEHPDVQLQEYDTYSKCVEELVNGTVDALTTDDTILAGYASQQQYAGKLKLVGKPFSEEKYGIGLKKDDTEMCQKVTDALKKMVDSGEWQKIVDANLGPAGFKPGPGNPPTPAACG